jgi:hypothetical protein
MSATKFDPWGAIGLADPRQEARDRVLDAEIEREERLAIQNEPELPAPGTPERTVIDLAHARAVRGLLLVARKI